MRATCVRLTPSNSPSAPVVEDLSECLGGGRPMLFHFEQRRSFIRHYTARSPERRLCLRPKRGSTTRLTKSMHSRTGCKNACWTRSAFAPDSLKRLQTTRGPMWKGPWLGCWLAAPPADTNVLRPLFETKPSRRWEPEPAAGRW